MNTAIINRHLSWIDRGFSFEDIQAVRREIRKSDPFQSIGTGAIDRKLGGTHAESSFSKSDLEKLTFLLVDDCDFDGDLHFLRYTRNLENMVVSGLCSERKVSDLRPIKHLNKLRKLHLDHQEIKDVSALSGLQNLKEVYLYKNPIETIKPLTSLQNLHRAEFSEIDEEEIFQLLQNSKAAKVSFSSSADQYSYDAYWFNDWAFKTTYFKDRTGIVTTIEPILHNGRTFATTAPENLRAMLQKSKDIAVSLLGIHQKIDDSRFTYREKSHLLKGRFDYSDTYSPKFDFQDSRN